MFFEVVLIPMWFVIAHWGDAERVGRRVGAANTFILYTLLGSAVMLLGFLLVGLQGRHVRHHDADRVAPAQGLSHPTQVLAFARARRSASR